MHSLLACLSLTLLNHPRSGSHRLLEEKVNSLAEIMLHFRLPFDQSLLCVLVVWQSRSEEHTSELQSQSNLVCRLLLEKKKAINSPSSVGIPTTCIGALSRLIFPSRSTVR